MIKLKVGQKAPAFSAMNEEGLMVNLSDYKGQKLVLFFYPKDDSPSCTKAACSLRDNYKKLSKEGFTILGISPDKHTKHRKFIDKYEFQYSLIADPDKKIINDYGLWGPKKFMGRVVVGVHRTTFILNEEGIITSIIDKVVTKNHADQILEAAANDLVETT